ncbi:MAG TPA: signal peptidase I [Candidatus Kapabacteria bacterium]|nr:signal peptidase I [Candidatus Kapabacteria bacterium]
METASSDNAHAAGPAPDSASPATGAGERSAAGSNGNAENNRRLRRLLRSMLITGSLLLLLRLFVLEPFGIPTSSMRPTILDGDVVLVNKLPYRISTPHEIPFTSVELPHIDLPGTGSLQRGDVVVFDYPDFGGNDPGEGSRYVKRVVALRGDTVQLVDERIAVNGIEVPPVYDPDDDRPDRRRSPIAGNRALPLLGDGRPVIVPYAGLDIAMDSLAAMRWRPWIEGEGVSVAYNNRMVLLGGLPATHYVFKRDYFFALGDNSVVSRDSRIFGFVPYDNLIGRVWLIYWSSDPDGGVRWSRMGTVVR